MDHPCDVTESKSFSAVLSQRGKKHQARGDPRESGEVDFRKGGGEKEPGQDGQPMTRGQQRLAPKLFQLAQSAGKPKSPEARSRLTSPEPAPSPVYAIVGLSVRVVNFLIGSRKFAQCASSLARIRAIPFHPKFKTFLMLLRIEKNLPTETRNHRRHDH